MQKFALIFLFLCGSGGFASGIFHLFPPADPCAVNLEILATRKLLPEGTVALVTPRLLVVQMKEDPSKYSLVSRAKGVVVGHMWMQLDKEKNVGIGPYIDPDYRREGLMTEAKYAGLKYAFEKLGAVQSTAATELNNVGSQGLHLKLGYQETRGPQFYHYQLSRDAFRAIDEKFQQPGSDFKQFLPAGKWQLVPKQILLPKIREISDWQGDNLEKLRASVLSQPALADLVSRYSADRAPQRFSTVETTLRSAAQVLAEKRDRELKDVRSKQQRQRIEGEYYRALTELGAGLGDAILYHEFFNPEGKFQTSFRLADYAGLVSVFDALEKWGDETNVARFAVRKRIKELRRAWDAAKLVKTVTVTERVTVDKP